jgi:membrane protease YdiL (CAAX protease family)
MLLALPAIWVACVIAGYLYSQQQGIPANVAWAALPAFLLEITFYYTMGVERWRARLERLPMWYVALGLTAAAVAPYTAAALAFHAFRWAQLGWIFVLAGVVAFWFVVLPRRPVADVLFLLLLAAVMLTRVFHRLYPESPHPRVTLYVLGQLMWIRTGVFALLSVRRVRGVGFGFWPGLWEWKIGATYFAMFAPLAAVVAWVIGFARPHLPGAGWERITLLALGTFFGALWVIALGEEFFFRGLLQQWIRDWSKSEAAGLVAASLLFGAVHLWFRGFPNWRFAVVAAVAGVFYGLAFRKAKSIRASMVTHALVVTTWRMFF